MGFGKTLRTKTVVAVSVPAAVLAVALTLAPATAAHGLDGDTLPLEGREPGQPDVKRVDGTVYRFSPAREEYEVRTPGEQVTWVHADPLPELGRTSAAPGSAGLQGASASMYTGSQNAPICRTSGHRIVPVYSHRPGQPSLDAGTKSLIQTLIRLMNGKFVEQTAGTRRELEMAVDCDAQGAINVYDVTTADKSFQTLFTAVPNALLGSPSGSGSVKYLIFDYEADENLGGRGQIASNTLKSQLNPNNSQTLSAVIWGPYAWERYVTVHELLHTFGSSQGTAPYPQPPFSTEGFHCVDGIDVLCYDDNTWSAWGTYTETACEVTEAKVPIDCGKNTYFDSNIPQSGWLSAYWNAGGAENQFLVARPYIGTMTQADIGGTEATVQAPINPEGAATTFYVEYGRTYWEGYEHKVPIPAASIGAGMNDVIASQQITGLERNTQYRYRIVAANDGGTVSTGEQAFKTAGPPALLVKPATGVTANSMTMHGSVDPQGALTSYRFSYGKTPSANEVWLPTKSAGSGDQPVSVEAEASGLNPDTLYYFKLSAFNASENKESGTQSVFTKLTPAVLESSFGTEGSADGQLQAPQGVAVDASGSLWVVDSGNNRVQKFDSAGNYVTQFGSKGTGDGKFETPIDIAITAGGDLWVTDSGNHRVQKFSSSGVYQGQFGSSGTGNGQFVQPWGIAISSSGDIWVSDHGHHRVQEFSAGGAFVRSVGSGPGAGSYELSGPSGLAVGNSGDVWIADSGNHRLQHYSSSGIYLATLGTQGSGEGELEEPVAVDFRPSGELVVSDRANGRVQQYTTLGAHRVDFGAGALTQPTGIAVVSNEALFVANTGANRVERWRAPLPEAVTLAASAITDDGATLAATVNPRGAATSYRFEYGKTTAYGRQAPSPDGDAGAADSPSAQEETVSGLLESTTYHYRVVATNASGTSYGADQTLATKSSETPVALAAMPMTEPFDGSATAVANFGSQWNQLGWVGSKGAHGLGTLGWSPACCSTQSGAYYNSQTYADTGTGLATILTMAWSPATVGNSFSIWLDIADPLASFSQRSGYWAVFEVTTYPYTFSATLYKLEEGLSKKLDSAQNLVLANGNSLALVDRGSTVSVWANTGSGFAEILSGADSSFSGGRAAIQGLGTGVVNSFKAGPLPALPEPATGAATEVKATTAVLNGTVNPKGTATTYYFEYGTTTSYGSKSPFWGKEIGSGTSDVAVSQLVIPLSQGTTYHYRVAAANASGTVYGDDKTLTTLKVPKATTTAASAVTTNGATLKATINPEGSATDYYFEYGPTTSYGTTVPIPSKAAGSGTGNVSVSEPISSLKARSDYHYRVVATSYAGTVSGGDQTLTTLPNPPVATTGSATNLKATEATVNGTVDPSAAQASYYFEYGETESYGSKTPTEAIQGTGEAKRSPGTVVSTWAGGESEAIWSGAGNAKSSDNKYASVENPPYQSHYLKATNFGITLPNGAVPVGVSARIERRPYGEESATSDRTVKLVKSGAVVGENKARPGEWQPYFEDVYIGYGSDRDLWGVELSKADVESEDFGIVLAVQSYVGAFVDHIELTVHYAIAPVSVGEVIGGLKAGTTYHYRLLASNPGGTSTGSDQTFTTSTSLVPEQLAGMAVTEPFNGTTSAVSDFGADWSALGWASGSPAKGANSAGGWGPSPAYPTVNGAYYGSTVTDTGPGTAAVATLGTNPGIANRYFSLWLDMPSPAGTRAGYELRFTNVSTNAYDVALSRWQAGSQTVLASKSGYSFVNGNSFALADQGGTVTAWTNTGSGFGQLLSASDSSFSAGSAGVEGAGNITRLTNFRAGSLLSSAGTTDAALKSLPINDSFATDQNPLAGDWAALSWDNSSSGHNTGRVSGGWGPWDGFSTVNGAYWSKNTSPDTGAGVAAAALLFNSPSIASRYFSLWLDMPSPASAKTGYELRFTETSTGVYEVILARWQAGAKTTLATKAGYSFATGSLFALVDKGATVSAWTKAGSEYTQLLSAADAAFKNGYAGVEASGNISRLKDFRSGPLPPL